MLSGMNAVKAVTALHKLGWIGTPESQVRNGYGRISMHVVDNVGRM